HNPKVVGSNPAPATNFRRYLQFEWLVFSSSQIVTDAPPCSLWLSLHSIALFIMLRSMNPLKAYLNPHQMMSDGFVCV
ncbi:hypothetical protein, partial [Vibrio parahaemolyticus]|uniref:hypothetical protein n=1 Tax=Vibrio parahaemolyticus TaxID=670 RepID=UPI001E2E54C6